MKLQVTDNASDENTTDLLTENASDENASDDNASTSQFYFYLHCLYFLLLAFSLLAFLSLVLSFTFIFLTCNVITSISDNYIVIIDSTVLDKSFIMHSTVSPLELVS